MQPLDGIPGKQYLAIKCPNEQCRQNLLLAELPPQLSWEAQQELKRQQLGLTVRCPFCTQEAPIEERKMFISMVGE
jgi:hypothetical protein